MAEDMSAGKVPLTIIVAATVHNGIGKNNALPWPMLRKEMAYFARVTKRVPTSLPGYTDSLPFAQSKQPNQDIRRQNAVIMGRRTWESIPTKFRPLKDRTNVVISSQSHEKLAAVSKDVIVAPSIESGLAKLADAVKDGTTLPLGRAFVIGGSSIYKDALALPETKHILLTRIHKDYDCDTFFPADNSSVSSSSAGWQRKTQRELSDYVGEEVPQGPITESNGDDEVQFEYQLYGRF